MAKKKPEEIKPENLVRIEREIPSIYDGKVIYCVVADTVQHPLVKIPAPSGRRFPVENTYKRTEETRDIRQIAGRAMAQGEHAVSKVRHNIMSQEAIRAVRAMMKRRDKNRQVWFLGNILRFNPVTTINLAARDSFELRHVRDLLAQAGIKHEVFYDTNEAVYGPGKVLTAVATYPITPEERVGILDYLPLWYRPERV
jgi:hypothetical protein